jgi:hypothetical protein
VWADITAYTVVDDNSSAGYPSGSTGTFMVPQYTDPGGKPLLKVTLTVIGHSSGGSNTFDNEDLAGGTATVSIGTEIKVSGPVPALGSQLIVRAAPLNSNSGPVAGDNEPFSGPPDFVGTDSISVSGTGATDTQSAFKTSAFDLTPYEGGGNVTFDFSTLTDTAGSITSTGGGANRVVFGDILSDYTATVTYESVPEPAGLALLCLAGLYTLHRRSRKPA